MLYDFKRKLDKISIFGIDISKYAIENSLDDVKENLVVGNATDLPFEENYFDLVISITTIHNLEKEELKNP